jgi:hypothetical protein
MRMLLDLQERSFGPAYDDDQLLDRVVELLNTGRLNACMLERPPVIVTTSPSAAPAFPLGSQREGRSGEAVSDPNTFGNNIDAAAIAEGQREAARNGVPFCEECERRRQAAEAA